MIEATPSSQDPRMTDLSRAISAIFFADHGQRHWLKEPHPPFTATDALAVGDRGDALAYGCSRAAIGRGDRQMSICELPQIVKEAIRWQVFGPEWRLSVTMRWNESPEWVKTSLVIAAHTRAEAAAKAIVWAQRGVDRDWVAVTVEDTPIPAPLSLAQPVEAVPGVLDGAEALAGVLGAPACPFDYRMDPGIAPDQPYPVCVDLGTFPREDDPPSRCVAP